MPTGTELETRVVTAAIAAPDGFTRDSEAQLVAQARIGSSDAMEQLLQRYRRRVFHLARNITTNHEDAEEVVQNAFAKAFRNLATFRGDSRFSTWLVRITVNEALMKVRGKRPKEVSIDETTEGGHAIVSPDLRETGPNPEERYFQEELRRILATSIRELEPGYRNVVQLRDLAGFSTKQTAQALDLPSSTVKARLRRARIRLRNSLGVHFRPQTATAIDASDWDSAERQPPIKASRLAPSTLTRATL
jgi:RNA polymerase sigma-70 factor, ECF subfamily